MSENKHLTYHYHVDVLQYTRHRTASRYQQTHWSLWSFSHCYHNCHSAVSTPWLYASILCDYTGHIKRVITKCIHTQFGSFTSWLTNKSNKSRKADDAKRAWLPPWKTWVWTNWKQKQTRNDIVTLDQHEKKDVFTNVDGSSWVGGAFFAETCPCWNAFQSQQALKGNQLTADLRLRTHQMFFCESFMRDWIGSQNNTCSYTGMSCWY